MSAARWATFIVFTIAAFAAMLLLYRRREPAGRGRTLLACMRAAAIALLLLIIFDPRFSFSADAGGRSSFVLLDGSLSMNMPAAGGGAPWDDALRAARSDARARSIVFGESPAVVSVDSAARLKPSMTHTFLLPALRTAAEAGATSVTIVSDGGIEDAAAVAEWLPRLGMKVHWASQKNPSPDLAMTEFDAPSYAEPDKPVGVTFAVQANSTKGNDARDSLTVTLRQGSTPIATVRVARPAPGRMTTGRASVKPVAPQGGGYVRLSASIDDAFADDNVRTRYVYVGDDPPGIVLVSITPDWEPRFLLPVLERAVALPARGYLRTTTGSWARIGAGLAAGARASDADVQRALRSADLVVIHNASRDEPSWITDAIQTAPRIIVLPGADPAGLPLPLALPAASQGDWFASADVPASPVAALFAGLSVDDVPPIDAAIPADLPADAWTPLVLTRGRRGTPTPMAAAADTDGRRWAVALGSGYWHWAFQGGAAGDLYNRLWSALGGWIMRDATTADVAAVRPVQRVVMRAEPLRWIMRANAMDSVRIVMHDSAGLVTSQTVRAVRDTATQQVLAPGVYTYQATGFAGSNTVSSEGEVTVESYSPEFARVDARLGDHDAAVALRTSTRDTKPLHASWPPYLLLLLLLCSEWILRRRWGLR